MSETQASNEAPTIPSMSPGSDPIKNGVDGVSWREIATHVQSLQELKKKASYSNSLAKVAFPDADKPLRIAVISDWHAGSLGTNYDLWFSTTDYIKKNGILALCVGDMLQMSIIMRSILENADNAVPPEMQFQFLKSWVSEMGGAATGGNLLASTWDNHAVMRTEKLTGINEYGRIFANVCHYFNGIGHLDIQVGPEHVYKIALAHFFRGRSMYNPVHGQMRYARMESGDREVVIAGDSHTPGFAWYTEAGMERLAINAGTFQTHSGYGQRFFSLKTFTNMPCFTLDPHTHEVQPFKDMQTMVKSTS